MSNYFEVLNAINVNDRTEKKGNLTYLSWAWAWGEVKKLHPDMTCTVYEDSNGCMYHTDGRTCWVKVGVTINGLEYIEYLPVMDNRNQSIPVERVTSRNANDSIQRALTKAIARHGLGLYIYAGEDLPDGASEPELTGDAAPWTEGVPVPKVAPKYSASTPKAVQEEAEKRSPTTLTDADIKRIADVMMAVFAGHPLQYKVFERLTGYKASISEMKKIPRKDLMRIISAIQLSEDQAVAEIAEQERIEDEGKTA